MTTVLDCQRDGDITILTLNHPKTRNALSADMLIELHDRLLEAAGDTACRAVILMGAGGHFCTGGDISSMTPGREVLAARQRIERAHRVIRLLVGGPKPVVAAVEGYAFGAGLSLAMACDVVVSSSTAKYAAVFAKVGLIPDMGLLWTLPQRVGVGESRKLFFSSRTVEAQEALQLGMVDHVIEPDELLAVALATAKELTATAPLSVAVTKAAYAKGAVTLEDVLRTEVEQQPMLYQSQDHNEAIAAFREKRKSTFKGV